MAIKYYSIPSQKKTVAILTNTSLDAINKIKKLTHDISWMWCTDKYMMPHSFRVTVSCTDGDTYDEELGKEIAKKKLLKKYYKAFDARLDMFKADLITLNSRVFETPEEIKNNA